MSQKNSRNGELSRHLAIVHTLRLAWSHLESGRLSDAQSLCRQVLLQHAEHPEALHLLGIITVQAGDAERGVEYIRRCLRQRPDWAEAYNNLGVALSDMRSMDEAIAAHRQALRLDPQSVHAMHNLGMCLAAQSEFDAAIEMYLQALHLMPGFVEGHNNLGNALKERGRPDEAIESYRRALRLNPSFTEAANNLAVALFDRGDLDESLAAFLAVLKIKPDYFEALNNLGNLLIERGQLDEAATILARAIQLKPDLAEAHNNLGNALKAAGRLGEAIKAYERSVELSPENSRFLSNLIYAGLFHAESGELATDQWHQAWNARFSRQMPHHKNDAAPDRPLRIGYISPDFRDHVVGRNILPLLREHDRGKFQIFCYARLNRRDESTAIFRANCDQWREITGLTDDHAAAIISHDRIDILIDLSMHLADNALPIVARKPAPVQMAFAAYPGSTGLEAVDYRITDPYLEVQGKTETDSSERAICLPDTFWCYEAGEAPAVTPLPALDSRHITFGCLSDFSKFNARIAPLWADVLKRVRGSRLLMLAPVGESRRRVLDEFRKLGVEPDRLLFVARQPRVDYLRTYGLIDIGLDTLPYNGNTTSLDSFWMGVPVVTRVGRTPVGRAGWSQLSNLDLTELAAQTDEEFATIAANLAGDLPKLAELRANLRQRMEQSPLTDAPAFARAIENLYRRVWRQWCGRQQPGSVVVEISPAFRRQPAKVAS